MARLRRSKAFRCLVCVLLSLCAGCPSFLFGDEAPGNCEDARSKLVEAIRCLCGRPVSAGDTGDVDGDVGESGTDPDAVAYAGPSQSIDCGVGDPVYASSKFCSVCVANGYFDVDDSCTCQPLSFDVDFCYYTDDQARLTQGVRSALDYASNVCAHRDPRFPDDDGGVDIGASTDSAKADGLDSPPATDTSSSADAPGE